MWDDLNTGYWDDLVDLDDEDNWDDMNNLDDWND